MALRNKLFWIERRVSAVFVFITLLEKDPSQNCPEIRGSQHVLGRLVINTLKTPQKVEKKKFYLSNRIRVLGSQPVNVIAGKVWCLCLWTVFVFCLSPGNGPLWKAWLSDKAICLSLLHLHRQYVPRSSNKRMLIR